MNAMILMSCLVFIDLEECTEKLENLTHFDKPKEVVPKKSKHSQKLTHSGLFKITATFVRKYCCTD